MTRAAALALALLGSLGCGEALRDTGPIGAWSREMAGGRRSIVSFWEGEDGQLRFRAVRFGPDGTAELRCEADGRCIELAGGTPALEFRFRVERRAGDPGIFVDCDGRSIASGVTPIRYVLRFEIAAGGLSMDVTRVEINGRPLARPAAPGIYRKTSNDPFARG